MARARPARGRVAARVRDRDRRRGHRDRLPRRAGDRAGGRREPGRPRRRGRGVGRVPRRPADVRLGAGRLGLRHRRRRGVADPADRARGPHRGRLATRDARAEDDGRQARPRRRADRGRRAGDRAAADRRAGGGDRGRGVRRLQGARGRSALDLPARGSARAARQARPDRHRRRARRDPRGRQRGRVRGVRWHVRAGGRVGALQRQRRAVRSPARQGRPARDAQLDVGAAPQAGSRPSRTRGSARSSPTAYAAS